MATITLNAFVKRHNGKQKDFESEVLGIGKFPKDQPYQCWDAGAFYNYQVVGGGKNFYTGDGCAAGVYANFRNSPLQRFYKRLPYVKGMVPKPGDIAVWNYNLPGSGGCGHLDIVLAVGSGIFTGFDQNWNGAYMHKVKHDYRYILGFLRPKANIPTETPAKSAPNKPIYYTVKPGEYLSLIAGRFGTSWQRLWKLNPKIKDPNLVRKGEKIRVR